MYINLKQQTNRFPNPQIICSKKQNPTIIIAKVNKADAVWLRVHFTHAIVKRAIFPAVLFRACLPFCLFSRFFDLLLALRSKPPEPIMSKQRKWLQRGRLGLLLLCSHFQLSKVSIGWYVFGECEIIIIFFFRKFRFGSEILYFLECFCNVCMGLHL